MIRRLPRVFVWLVPTLLAVAALFLVALPSWRAARQNVEWAERLEADSARWGRWMDVGASIERTVDSRSRRVDERWERLFPRRKDMDLLFLDLARIADDCEVRDFFLAELGSGLPGGSDSKPDPTESPAAGMDEGTADAPASTAELKTYAVRTRFEADLESTARFLDELESIPRALDVRKIDIRDSGTGLLVEMEMELYVSS